MRGDMTGGGDVDGSMEWHNEAQARAGRKR